MSRDWNGLSLQNEFAELLGDTTTAFKARVLKWMNDIQQDICSSHNWGFLKEKGKKILTASAEEQTLLMTPPGAPTVALSVGGSLTESSVYSVVVTFVESVSGIESLAGTASASLTATSTDKTIDVSAIPVSSEPLVTGRNIYLITDGSEPVFYSSISDNTTTTATINAATTSTIEALDYNYIDEIIGDPFIESTGEKLAYRDLDQLRLLFEGSWPTGSPYVYSLFKKDSVILYPIPSSALTLSFYYKKFPKRLVAAATSYPDIPYYLKETLEAGVKWKGMRYRDRDGEVTARNHYIEMKREAISRFGRPSRRSFKVRDVIGNSDGFEINRV